MYDPFFSFFHFRISFSFFFFLFLVYFIIFILSIFILLFILHNYFFHLFIFSFFFILPSILFFLSLHHMGPRKVSIIISYQWIDSKIDFQYIYLEVININNTFYIVGQI